MRDLARARRLAALFVACVPWFAGCAALPKFESPKLSVVALKVQGGDFFSQRLQVRLRVFNPNARELPISGIAYRIDINDTEIGNGSTAAPFTVPAMGEVEFDMQLTANLVGALGKLLSRRKSEELAYRLVGDVSLSSGFLRRIPFDERGSVKL
ncbi:MAG TPA: LEA type 2 family protein [Steroidobacteraceae bacterium]|jgi:LEA14-like dessication related protein|nr:LEA type 2 family protein [Steroidobacteraceae bacterium]